MIDRDLASGTEFSSEELEVIQYLLEEEGIELSQDRTIPRRENLDHCPLSFAQQRLWLLHQLEPGLAAYNVPAALRLVGPLDVAALERSLNRVVRRHEVLRTSLALRDDQPVQVVAPSLYLPLPIIDLSHLPGEEREAEARRMAVEDARQSFDLKEGVLRARLLRLDREEHVLLLNVHHIATDGWSQGVLYHELSALYQAFVAGRPSPLSDLPIQYADYALWQRKQLQGPALERLLEYWKRQLDGMPVLQLPTDRPRPPTQTYAGARHELRLPADLAAQLKALSEQEGCSLFMTLLAAFQVLLYRYTGQEDIAVGSPIANRTRVETEGLIGLFMNTLVMRTDLSGGPTFRELLARVRETALDAYSHQDIPFDRLVEEINPVRDTSRAPLFQVLFALQNMPRHTLTLSGLTVSPLNRAGTSIHLDLELYIRETGGVLNGTIGYNTDLFDAQTISRLAGHYQTLLAGIVAQPDRAVAHLSLLTETERRLLLVEWNDTATGDSREGSLQVLFEAQVERTPEATAFVDRDRRLTYRQLNTRANQMAQTLQAQGVGPEVIVGLCIERSLEMVVALLAIVKAGGAFLPLDPGYPRQRLSYMLRDAGASVLLTTRALAARLPEHQARTVYIDGDAPTIAVRPWSACVENPRCRVTRANLAYVIYTSGSTGQPKGVAVPHDQILNRLAWMWDAYPFQAGEVGCQRTALSFVDSIWEIFGPLLQGVPTAILDDVTVRDPQALVQALAAHRVSRLWVVPSLLRVLLDSFPGASPMALQQRLPRLRFWVTSGEALPVELDRRFREAMPDSTLYNLYGTSEVWDVTWYEPDPRHNALGNVPIGRPITNTQAYVLDRHLHPVPVGVPGELYVGGAGLARGYLHRPAKTASSFIPHPFSADPGARLYRTGDLARFLPDGQIEFLGRSDHQVKLRGFRIELGEIETALCRHPGVRNAVVVLREDVPSDKRLVAYVIPAGDDRLDVGSLRALLRDRLPGYMVPSAFLLLDALPLTPNGKVDRSALPAPGPADSHPESAVEVPRDGLERRLAHMWEQVLGVQPVGRTDDFFELGGHSLLAIRLFAQIKEVLGNELPVSLLFRFPTVEQLAGAIRRHGPLVPMETSAPKASARERSAISPLSVETSDVALPLVPIQTAGSYPPFFCIHPVGGGVMDYFELSRFLGPDQPFYGLRARGLNGTQGPHTRIEDMAAHYVEAIRQRQAQGPYYLGGYCYGGIVAFEMARQLQTQRERVALLAILEGHAPGRVEVCRQRWQPQAMLRFLGNLPFWVRDRVRRPGAFRRLLARSKTKGDGHRATEIRDWERDASQVVMNDVAGNVAALSPKHRETVVAHLRALHAYQPQSYSGRVTLFRAQARSLRRAYDPELGWGRLAEGGVEVQLIPGDHYDLLECPYVEVLADKLALALSG